MVLVEFMYFVCEGDRQCGMFFTIHLDLLRLEFIFYGHNFLTAMYLQSPAGAINHYPSHISSINSRSYTKSAKKLIINKIDIATKISTATQFQV